MKKIFLVIVCLLVCVATFVGCTQTPVHKKMSITWGDFEKYTYEVEHKISDDKTIKGEYVVTIEKIKSNEIKVGDKVINGYGEIGANLIKTTLIIGDDIIKTESLLRNNFLTVASYRYSKIKDEKTQEVKETIVNASYDGKQLYTYNIEKNGEKSEGSLKSKKTPIFDNEVMYQAFRCVPYEKNALSLQFYSPSWSENKLQKLTISSVADVEIKLPELDVIKAKGAKLRLNQTFPGAGKPLDLYFSVEPLKVNDSVSFNRVLVKIMEDKVTYSLKSFTNQK